MINFIKLMRLKHYIKNFLIFLPVIFSGKLFTDFSIFKELVLGFVAFSLTCSAIYIINDICDAPKDRLHETKRNRPIASGKVKISEAIILAMFLIFIALVITTYLSIEISYYCAICIGTYFILNALYSFKLKNYPIIDVTILASGFLIRTIYGGILARVIVSNWLYLTVLSMSFFLGLGKRRNEIIKYGDKNSTRNVLNLYNKEFLDKNMYVCLALTIVFYALWTTDSNIIANVGSNALIWTVPLIIIICMKYSLDLEYGDSGDPVEVLLKDKILMLLLIIYILIILFIYK